MSDVIENRECRRCGKDMPINWGTRQKPLDALSSKTPLAYTCADCITPEEIAAQTQKLKAFVISGGMAR